MPVAWPGWLKHPSDDERSGRRVTGMAIHGFDFLVGLYLAWGLARGWVRGVGRELHGLIRLALIAALVVGFSVFTWLRAWFEGVVGEIPHLTGVLGASTALVATLWVLYLARSRFGHFVERRMSPGRVRTAGGLVGVLRTGLAAFLLAGLLGVLPLQWLGDPVNASWTGRGAQRVGEWIAHWSPLAPPGQGGDS